KLFYFAYGSNMDPEQMKERQAKFFSRKGAVLRGWQLVFNVESKTWKCGVANIVEKEAAKVEGVLYEITKNSLDELDRYEGFPRKYQRKLLSVESEGKEYKAEVYISKENKDGLKPSKRYLKQLLKGQDVLSKEYVEMLRKVETQD
ncbi:MAG: gamma-glutamylcyclotransferase family protein, partial [Candidatus Methanosuratincola petrocarbonis]